MKEKEIIKTVFNFFIIDLIIFGIISFVIAFIIVFFISIPFENIGRETISFIQLILLLIFMFWNYKYRYQSKFKEEDAIKVLKLRYANGDITKEEYEKMKKDLE